MASKSSDNYIQEYKDRTFRGFTIRIYPFPTGLFEKINSQTEEKFPYPLPPKKDIKTLGEIETIDDAENPEYLKKKEAIDAVRKNYAGTLTFGSLLESCLEVLEKEAMENKIKRLQKIGIDFPEDEDERQQDFIVNYLVRTEADYTTLVLDSIGMTVTGSEEVAERLSTFQRQMERRTSSITEPPRTKKE